MSVFDHVYYHFHHDHINTPLITPLELQMVGRVSHENWGVITPPPVGVDKSLDRPTVASIHCKVWGPSAMEP